MTAIEKIAMKDIKRNWRPLWNLFWCYFPKFLFQERNWVKACLLATMRGFYEFYGEVPSEEEMENMTTERACKFNMFANILLNRTNDFLQEEGMPEEFEIVEKADRMVIAEVPGA